MTESKSAHLLQHQPESWRQGAGGAVAEFHLQDPPDDMIDLGHLPKNGIVAVNSTAVADL